MIARQWIGETREAVADAYFKYLEATGVKECEAAKGIKASGCCGAFTTVRPNLFLFLYGIQSNPSRYLLDPTIKRPFTIPRMRNSF